MRPLRPAREHGGVRAHGRDGGHDAHRSNGENVLGYVRAEPRPLRNAERAFDSPPAFLWRARRRSRVLYPAAVCFDKASSAGRSSAGEKIFKVCMVCAAVIRPRFRGLRGLTAVMSHKLGGRRQNPPPDRLAIFPKKDIRVSWRVIPQGTRHTARHASIVSPAQSRRLAEFTVPGVFVAFIAKKPFSKL
jgi:hypothetical protein